MKTSRFNLFLATCIALCGQAALGAGQEVALATNVVMEQAAHHRVWQRVNFDANAPGQLRTNRAYTEIATGLNYWNAAAERWLESKEEISAVPNGAAATNGQHQVLFSSDLNTAVAVDMPTPDGKRLQSRVLGLSYFDTVSGSNVLIAEVKSCQGVSATWRARVA